jgi:predicted nucleic acid-binding protein
VTAVLVDSNVIIDLLTRDSTWFEWSYRALIDQGNSSRLVINAVIYAEVSVRYSRIEDLDEDLPTSFFSREDIPFAAGFLAGKCHMDYRKRGGQRTSPLPDFLIGAHARIANYRLLTRDPQRFRTYFEGLQLISPGVV